MLWVKVGKGCVLFLGFLPLACCSVSLHSISSLSYFVLLTSLQLITKDFKYHPSFFYLCDTFSNILIGSLHNEIKTEKKCLPVDVERVHVALFVDPYSLCSVKTSVKYYNILRPSCGSVMLTHRAPHLSLETLQTATCALTVTA